MRPNFTRREAVFGLTASALCSPPTIETYVHLFDPAAEKLAHSIVVHPEPYQDDHRYLEYCLAHEPRPGYFKATCRFDPFSEDTARRMRALSERWPTDVAR